MCFPLSAMQQCAWRFKIHESPVSMYKTDTKNEAKRLRITNFAIENLIVVTK